MSEKYLIQNPEVLYSADSITITSQLDIDLFKRLASQNPRKRIRLCTHGNTEDLLHEMLIVHERGAYVRPHKHLGKSESIHIIEGMVDVVLFEDDGQIKSVVRMGDYASGRSFYSRLATPCFHTLIIHSDLLVFHETTNGPFDRRNTIFAPWAPDDSDDEIANTYMANLREKVLELVNYE